MSLKCAVQLGIPYLISDHGKPITLLELVSSLSIPSTKCDHLRRLMSLLVHSHIFSVQKILHDEGEEEEEGYVLTPSSKLLLKSSEENLSAFVLAVTEPFMVTPSHFFSAWFRGSDSTPFSIAHGVEIWNIMGQNSDAGNIFNTFMVSDTDYVMSMAKKHKALFEGYESLVDVGGGKGVVAKTISKAFPRMKCTPHIVFEMQGTENLKFVSGDMFENVPPAHIILLKWIMHDWSDAECVKILKNCKDAIIHKENGGKVIIIDMVIDEMRGKYDTVQAQLCMDILMMSSTTGKERTEIEWEKLFKEAGFTAYKITNGLGLMSIIEVFP